MEAKDYRFEVPVEYATRKKHQVTVLGIGTTGLQVVDHLFNMGIKDTRFMICHVDIHHLMASPVPNKLLYEVDSESEERDFMHQLSFMLKSSELTIIVTDLSTSADCHLATSAVRMLAEQGEFNIVTLGLPAITDPQIRERITRVTADLQEQASSLLLYEQAEIPFQERIWQLGGAVFRMTEFCSGFIDEDFDTLRNVIKSPGRIAIASGRGIGPQRTHKAVGEAVAQVNTQSFITHHTQGLMVITCFSGYQPLLVREQTELMNTIMAFVSTEPNVVKLALIQDGRLGEELVINLLLWAPSQPGELIGSRA